jgi:hypothetical protein
MSRLGRIAFGRTTEVFDIPRPDYAQSLQQSGFEELAKPRHPDEESGGKSVI